MVPNAAFFGNPGDERIFLGGLGLAGSDQQVLPRDTFRAESPRLNVPKIGTRSSSGEGRIRVPDFFSVVYFRGTLPQKIGEKGTTGGPRLDPTSRCHWAVHCVGSRLFSATSSLLRHAASRGQL